MARMKKTLSFLLSLALLLSVGVPAWADAVTLL